MAFTPLHQFNQNLFHHKGVCYWACEYMMNTGAWKDYRRKTYDELVISSTIFTKYQACIGYARSKNIQRDAHQVALPLYAQVMGRLDNNRCYRIACYYGTLPMLPTLQNHEIMCFCGNGTSVLLFDPNFGFYRMDAVGIAAVNNREVLEYYLDILYGVGARGEIISNFVYRAC